MDKPRSPVLSGVDERLRENEQRLAGIVNSEDMFVCRVDLLFRLTYMNEAFANAFAVGIGDATWPMVHPDDEEHARTALAQLQEPPHRGSIEVRNSIRGEWRWVRWTNSIIRDALGVPVEVQGIGIDITERKRGEASLSETNALLVAAERLAGLGGFEWNIATDAVVWSEAVYRNFGRDIKEGAPTLAEFIAAIHSDDRLRVQDAINAAVAGTRQYNVEYRIVRPDGSERIIHSRGEVARDQAGKAVRLTGASHDITERKQVEDKLRRSEERFRSYFELGLIGMAVTSPNSGITEVNDKICEILGYERAELLEKTWQELTHPEDLTADLANFDRVVAGDIDGYTLDKRFIRKDGAVVYTTIAVRCLRTVDRAVDHFVAFLQDITDRKEVQQTLEHSEQLLRALMQEREQSSRDLHDTVLQTIYAIGFNLEECQRLIVRDQGQAAVVQLSATIANLNDMIRDIREFIADQQQSTPTGSQLGGWLNALAQEMKAAHRVRFRIHIDPLAASWLGPDETRHMMGIAREAISNAMRHSHAKMGVLSLVATDVGLRFELSDNGIGMDLSAVRDCGQGMANLASRARSIGARLEIISIPGSGTRIIVDLPRKASASQAGTGEPT